MSTKVNRKFRKLSISERLDTLVEAGYMDASDATEWRNGGQQLDALIAERMIENVIGSFGLPEGLAINFPVNGKNYVLPLVVEEPSVVAALSYAGLLSEKSGGFKAKTTAPILLGQIQLLGVADLSAAELQVAENAERILASGNAMLESMVKRGGGVRKVSTHTVIGPTTGEAMLIVHLHIDTRDAMGANLVNSVCEGLAPLLAEITGGEPLLRILSNLADESIATAEVSFSPQQLALKTMSGESVRDRIVLANDFALADPYRATTHNKGIMNEIGRAHV